MTTEKSSLAAGSSGEGPRGLGGWLILPLLGLVATPVVVGIILVRDVLPAFEPEAWAALTTPGGPAYHPAWAPYLIVSLALNVVIFVGAIALFVLALRRQRIFPKLMITFYLISLGAALFDLSGVLGFVSEVVPKLAAELKDELLRDLARAAIACVIWIPYFLRSQRVRNTFVR